MGGGVFGDFGNTQGSALDTISDALTIASLIPGVDTIADAIAIPVDLVRGDYISAGLDLVGVIPIAGEVADAAKIIKMADKAKDAAKVVGKAGHISKKTDDAIDTLKTLGKETNISKKVKVILPTKLTKTHGLTLGKRRYNSLVENIKKNGIKESIKYVEHKGNLYVVDGHHRLRAAKQLGLDKVPIEKVHLPFNGYKTVEDLLWFD